MSPSPGDLTPIVPGTYPDPTICRVGGDYYLAHSSFEYFPGAPLFHSTDLVSWRPLGHILDRRSQFRRGDPRPSTGIWGSTLRHHDGVFWFVTTNASDYSAGQLLVRTDDPTGPWSEPTFIPEAIGIDPDLAWDDDGTCYLTWHALDFATGVQSIQQAPVNLETGELLAPTYEVWQGSGLPAAEGPHLYHVGDVWYLVLAEGGTERGHCVTVARAPHPWGPFESNPRNPILTRRSTTHPVQNVGHADLVDTPDGQWAAVYLGVRPRGSTPGFHVLGRETFLAGVNWVDGWPQLDTTRFTVPTVETWFTDDFSGRELDSRWVVPGGEADAFLRRTARGVTLTSLEDGSEPLLCTRVRDLRWTAEAVLSGRGRFVVQMDDRHRYGLRVQDGQVVAEARIGDVHRDLGHCVVAAGAVRLEIAAVAPAQDPVPLGRAGPDEIVLSVVDRGRSVELARLDGRYLSTEVASGFTGRMLGVGATASTVEVHEVTYRPGQEERDDR